MNINAYPAVIKWPAVSWTPNQEASPDFFKVLLKLPIYFQMTNHYVYFWRKINNISYIFTVEDHYISIETYTKSLIWHFAPRQANFTDVMLSNNIEIFSDKDTQKFIDIVDSLFHSNKRY